ncbi:MAG: RIP metalloprotease RseP [Candidatus Neomarinimicrobiota bacterium]
MTTVLATAFVLLVLIFIHELGHFLAARSVGVKVLRLSLGFPPRLFSFRSTSSGWIFRFFFFRRNDSGKLKWLPVIEKAISKPLSRASETDYCVALVPLGGFVRMAGTIDENLDETITGAPHELASKNRVQQVWVMSAGVLMNVLLAVLVFAVLTYLTGIPEFTDEPIILEVLTSYPAEEAGMARGDRILRVADQRADTWTDVRDLIRERPLETISIQWERDGEVMTAGITPREEQNVEGDEMKTVGLIGISGGYEIRNAGVGESLGQGFLRTGIWFGVIVKSLKMIATGEVSIKEIGGPILIAQLAGQSAQEGFLPLLNLLAVISVNLAFINIMPIPALDGGHIMIILIEAIARRQLSAKVRMVIQQAGMALLLLLILVIIYNDLTRLFVN